MERSPSDSYSLTLRVRLSTRAGTLGEVATAIGKAGGDIGAIDIVSAGRDYIIRDITVNTVSSEHEDAIVKAVEAIDGIEVEHVSDRTFLMHLGGKIEVVSKMPLKTRADLSMAYTPGVARVCEAIHEDPEKVFTLTIKKNTVAIVTDGTAVLGLGDIGAIDIVSAGRDHIIRDITVNTVSSEHEDAIVKAVEAIDGIEVEHVSDRTFLMHLGGKIEVVSKMPLKTRADLSMAYTPGVARVCEAIHEDPEKVFTLTIKKNTVAIVTDGTAVLGLGDIGPAAAMPVMEGKAMLFKEFGGVNAFPICLNTKDPDEIVRTVKAISTAFGGINLEDISAPRCFEIEERLKEELDIPVFHDDQHGTAVVVLAALINALKIVGKQMSEIKVVVNGVGAAGVACSKIIMHAGVTNIIGCDQHGALYRGRGEHMNSIKTWYAEHTNPNEEQGTLHDIIKGADVFLGLSVPGVLSVEDVQQMADKPIVFAMANPTPEIMPEDAAPYVVVMATGRSDYPNQINNVLCFPGIFRGALACRARTINEEMKLAAAHAIAGIISDNELHPEYIIPSVFDKRVGEAVAAAVEEAAYQTRVARRDRAAQDEM